MADRYWVGGNGTWNTTTTTNWSATSGGAGGASVPTSADDVFFDLNSNAGNPTFGVTITASVSVLSLTISGLAGTLNIGTNVGGALTVIGGNFSLPSSNIIWSVSNTTTFSIGSGSTQTINTGGNSFPGSVSFSGAGTRRLLSNMTVAGASTTLLAGTLDLNNFTLSTTTFVSTLNTNTRAFVFGTTGAITTTGSGTVWNVSNTNNNISYTGTPTVNISNNTATAVTINHNGNEAGAFNFNFINGTYSLTAFGVVFRDINFTGFNGTWVSTNQSTIYGNLTIPASGGTFVGSTTTIKSLTWAGTSGTKTITTNGRTVGLGLSIDGVGQTIQFADNFAMTSTQTFYLINGTLDVNSKTTSLGVLNIQSGTHAITNGTLTCASVTHTSGDIAIGTGYLLSCTGTYTFTAGSITINDGANLSVGLFSSANTGTRSIAFGTGSITTTSTGTVWNVTGTTGLSFTGTSNIIISNNTATAVTVTNTATAASAMSFSFTNGTYALTLTSGNSFRNLNFTGYAGTCSLLTNTYTMYGNLNLGSTATITATAGTSTFTWNSTSGTRTITSNGRTANFGIALNGVGQTLQLADAFIQGSTQTFAYTNGTFDMSGYSTSLGILVITTGTHAITNGTLNCASVTHTSGDLSIGTGYLLVCTGTYTFTAGTITLNDGVSLSVGNFSSSNSNTRSVAFGSLGSFIAVTGSGATAWNLATPTNFGYTGTPLVKLTYSGSVATTISSALTAISFSITAGTYLLTIATGTIIQNLDFTGFSGTYSQGATTCSVIGNITFYNAMTSTTTSGSISMTATSGVSTITSNGDTIGCSINFNGVGGTFRLADNFTQTSTASFIITNGTVDFNNVTYTLGILTFVSGTKSYINYGGTLSGTSIVHTSGAVTTGTGALLSTVGSYTFTAGSITINDGVTLSVGSFSSSNSNVRSIAFGTGAINITGIGTVWNTGTITNFSYTGTSNVRITNAGSSAITITAGAATAAQSQNFFITAGTYALTLSSGSNINNLDFTGFSGSFTLGGTVSLRGNLTLSSTTTSTSVAQSLSFIGSTVTQTITTAGVTIGCSISIAGTTNIVRLLDSLTQNSARALNLTTGTLDINSQTTNVGILTITTGTHAITNGTLTCASVTHTSGDLSIGSGYLVVSTGAYTFTAGSITINDNANLSVGSFSSANTGTRSIAFGTGSITTTSTGTVWNVTGVTGLTYTGTSNVVISNNTATAVTITNTATSASAMNFNIINGTYTLTLTTGNSYNNLDFTGFAGTAAFVATTHTIYGNLTLGTSMTTSATGGTNTFSWINTSGTDTIRTNGVTVNFGILLNGVGQTVQLADAFVQGSTQRLSITSGTFDMAGYSTSAGILTIASGTHAIANGTLNCASVTHTSGDLSIGTGYLVATTGTYTFTAGSITINNSVNLSMFALSTSNSNARSIAFDTGSLSITGNNTTVWNMSTSTGFTYTGTPTINFTYSGSVGTRTINAGPPGQNFTFAIIGSDSLSINGSLGVLDISSYAGTFNINGATSLYSDFYIPNTVTYGATSGQTLTFRKSSTTFTPSGIGTIAFNILLPVNTTVTLANNLTSTGSIILGNASINATGTIFDINNKTTSIGTLQISAPNCSIANGTINCTAFTHSYDFSIGLGYNVISSGTYTCSFGILTINDNIELVASSFTSNSSGTAKGIDFGVAGKLRLTGTGNITIFNSATGTTYFSFSGSKNIEINSSAINTDTLTINTVGLTSAQALNFSFTSGSYALTLTTAGVYNSLNFTGYSGTAALGTNTYTMYSNLNLGTTATITATAGTSTFTWPNTSGTAVITSNGRTANFGILLNGIGQTVQLGDAFVQGSSQAFGLTSGTFDMNNYSTSVGVLTILTGTHAIANGTLNCASVTHTSGDITVGAGYTLNSAGTYTWTAGSITINDNATITMFSMSSNVSNTRTVAFGTAGVIELTGNNTTVWLTNPTSLSYTGTSTVKLTSAATSGTTTINPGAATLSNAFSFAVTAGSYPLRLSSGGSFNVLSFTGYSGTLSLLGNVTVYGNITLGSGMSTSGTNSFTYGSGTYNAAITSNGVTFTQNLAFNNTGTITFNDNLITNGSISRDSAGTLTTAYNVTAATISVLGTTNMGNGNWTVTGSSWTGGGTINADNSSIYMSSSSAKTFTGGSKAYYNLIQSGAGALTISGSNSFNNITNTTQPATVTLTSGTTQTVSNFTLSGTLGNIITLNSTSAGSAATLSKSSGTIIVSYMSIADSTATGGAVWRAPINYGDTDLGGNTGWNFASYSPAAAVLSNMIAFF